MLKDIDELNCLIGQILNKRIKPSAFCWRSSWASRFESLWSLLRKFAYLNAITHREVRRLFGYDDAHPTLTYWNHCLRSDLRHCGALDPSKIAIILGINYKDLAEAVVLRYVNEHEAATLTSEFLRFCPTCINQGFHSSLHQLLFLTKCPAHGDKLQSRCTECLTLNIPYTLQSISAKDLLMCAHMLNGLKQHLTHSNMEELRREAANRARALLPEAKLLMTRVKINTPEELVSQWVPLGTGRRHFAVYKKAAGILG